VVMGPKSSSFAPISAAAARVISVVTTPGLLHQLITDDSSVYNVLDREGSNIIHLLINLLRDKIGTGFTKTVAIQRVR
jgi:hypothetical protein